MPILGIVRRPNVRTPIILAALITSLLGFLSACGGPEAQPLRFGAAVWQPGETSIYRVTDVNNEPAGTVRYEMQAPEPGTWRMERVTQTQGDEERLSVEMDETGFRTRASDLERISPDGSERVTASYDGGEVQLELTTTSDVGTSETANVPSDSRDARALFMLLRTLPLEIGYSTKINTYQPVTSRMARATVTVIGDEPVETPTGSFDAWLVVLDEGDRQSRAWIGKEAPYPLVKYIDASNGGLFELADYSQGE